MLIPSRHSFSGGFRRRAVIIFTSPYLHLLTMAGYPAILLSAR
nr:MAG TPA_asm: hypothetical protein [Caudoviricetes sp.]